MLPMKLLLALFSLASAQISPIQLGTIDVPVPRVGDCQSGPATYVYRLSSKTPNDVFPKVCSDMGGATVHFNNPCEWAHGQAQMTVAHFTSMCRGATRVIHWHNGADEWGFVTKGRLQTFVASPDGLPWPSSDNIISDRGVWFFPSGWLHGLTCLTPEEEGGCEFWIFFASPQAAEPNGHNLPTTLAQSPDDFAAAALGSDIEHYKEARPSFAQTVQSVHYSFSNMTAPIVTSVHPIESCCAPIIETIAAPAAMEAVAVEKLLYPSVGEGCVIHTVRTSQFPFSRTMSQERVELKRGARRPIVWASADGLLAVVSGRIIIGLEGGVLGSEAHAAFTNETLSAGDVAYLPNGRAYWFREATGSAPAETITVFNVGEWKSFEMATAVRLMPQQAARSNLEVPSSQLRGIGSSTQLAAAIQAPSNVNSFILDNTLVVSVLAIAALAFIGSRVKRGRRREGSLLAEEGPFLS